MTKIFKIGEIHFENPILNASGCWCFNENQLDELYSSSLAGIVCKTCTIFSKEGICEPNYYYNPENNTHFNCKTLNQNDYINYYNTYNNSVIEYFKDKPNFYLFYLNKDFNWSNIQKIINLDEETIRDNIVKSLEERGWKDKKNINLNGKIKDWEFLKSNINKLT